MKALLATLVILCAASASAQVGPQPTMTCPAAAISIAPGSSIQAAITNNPSGTSFCLKAGIHVITSSIVPKAGNTFTGEYGAILDGSTWQASADDAAVFRAHNTDVDGVTIRNLTCRNVPQRCIHVYPPNASTDWLIEYVDFGHGAEGIVPGTRFTIRRSVLHDFTRPSGHAGGLRGAAILAGGAYPNLVTDVLIEDNEIARCGGTQKLLDAARIIWRRNYIHHCDGPGIWNDGFGDGFLAEDNLLEDNGVGIMFELSRFGIIRRNVIRRSADQCIFVSTSRDARVYENRCEHNFRGISFFVNCTSVNQFPWEPDLRNNAAHDNAVILSAPGALANYLAMANCTSTTAVPYVSNLKQNHFEANTYTAPEGRWWYWGDTTKSFAEWQALGHDDGATEPIPPPEPPPPAPTDTTAPVITTLTVRQVGGSANRRVHVEATDNVAVARVDVLLNGAMSGSCAATPCDVTIRIPNSGIHVISAKAYDAAGNVSPLAPGVQTWR